MVRKARRGDWAKSFAIAACAGTVALVAGAGLLAHALEEYQVRGEIRGAPADVAAAFPRGGTGAAPARRRLLLCSHGRVQWLDVATGKVRDVHKGRGVYYGAFPGEGNTAWVVSRPHNWRAPEGAAEALLLLDLDSGAILAERNVPTRFTHDAIRAGERVFLADTGQGRVVELAYPSMDVVRTAEAFTLRQHVNTLGFFNGVPGGPPEEGVWAVLHNLGKSKLVNVDMDTAQTVRELGQVGHKSHGCVLWEGKFVMLSSDEGAVVLVDPQSPDSAPEKLWRDPDKTFMKGLTVIENVAYFGISSFGPRSERNSEDKTSEVGALDLLSRKLLWRRTVHTHGLLNYVSAPHLSVSSTYVAVPSWGDGGGAKPEAGRLAAQLKMKSIRPLRRNRLRGEPAEDGEVGLHKLLPPGAPPLIPLGDKKKAMKNVIGAESFKVDITTVDVRPIQEMLTKELWEDEDHSNAYMDGRQHNMHKFKPGVQTIHMIFSDQTATKVYRFPWWDRFEPVVQPIIDKVLSMYGVMDTANHTVRLQFARMRPGTHILPHRDMGMWVMRSHRVHIPIFVNDAYRFMVKDMHSSNHWDEKFVQIETREGGVFEINNAIPHKVDNDGDTDRVHLLLDWSEHSISDVEQLQPGQHCKYWGGRRGVEC